MSYISFDGFSSDRWKHLCGTSSEVGDDSRTFGSRNRFVSFFQRHKANRGRRPTPCLAHKKQITSYELANDGVVQHRFWRFHGPNYRRSTPAKSSYFSWSHALANDQRTISLSLLPLDFNWHSIWTMESMLLLLFHFILLVASLEVESGESTKWRQRNETQSTKNEWKQKQNLSNRDIHLVFFSFSLFRFPFVIVLFTRLDFCYWLFSAFAFRVSLLTLSSGPNDVDSARGRRPSRESTYPSTRSYQDKNQIFWVDFGTQTQPKKCGNWMALTWYMAARGKSRQTAQQRIPPSRLSSFSNFFTFVGCESNFWRFFSGSSTLTSAVCWDDVGTDMVADCSTGDADRFSTRISAVIRFEYELVDGKVAIWDVATLSVMTLESEDIIFLASESDHFRTINSISTSFPLESAQN